MSYFRPKGNVWSVITAPATRIPSRPASCNGPEWLAVLLVIATPIAVLWPVCTNGFVHWDDNQTIYQNYLFLPVTRQSFHTWWTAPQMDLYIPVTYSLWGLIDWLSHGAQTHNAVAFHVANLVLHALSCAVVFALLRLLIGKTWPAAAGAMLFGIHPVQVEAVAWVSGMKDVLGGLLALLAMWQYLVAVKQHRGERTGRFGWGWHYGAAMLAFVLALLAKPNEIAAPAIAGALDVLLVRRSWRAALRWLWPWLALSAACVVVALRAQPGEDRTLNVSLYLRPLSAIASMGFYAHKLLWPTNLAVDYGLRPELAARDPWLAVDCILLGLAAAALWMARRSARPIMAGAIIFVIALLPVLGWVTFDFQWYSNVADHYLYLPMFGVALMSAGAGGRWNGWGTAVGAAIALVALGTISQAQTHYWKDTQSLFSHEIAVNPNSSVGYENLALVALGDGENKRALELGQRSLRSRPDNPWAYVYCGLALWRMDRLAEAARAYRQAMEISRSNEPALEGRAGVLAEMGDFKPAESLQRMVVERNPASADARFKLGWILERENKLTEAIAEFSAASKLDASRADIHAEWGATLAKAGRASEARGQYDQAQRLDPQSESGPIGPDPMRDSAGK